MASSINRVDVFVKDYLLFRGFANALKGFEIDLKNDKDKGFRPDLVSEQLMAHAHNFELTRLVEYWSYLDRRMFSRLESQHQTSTRKLYSSLLKYYLVNSIQSGRSDKMQEFFERMTPELYGLSDWKDWFAIPYIKQPESVPGFEAFFSKQWQEALLLSVHNYVSVTMQCMSLPALVCAADLIASTDERDGSFRRPDDLSRRRPEGGSRSVAVLKGSVELMDDFYSLTQTMAPLEEATATSKLSSSNVKTTLMRPFRPQSSSAAPKSPAIKDKRKGSGPAASSSSSGSGGIGYTAAAVAVVAAATGALQQAAAIVQGTTTAAAAAAATAAFGPGGIQLTTARPAVAALASASSSGGGSSVTNDEPDKKKSSFFEVLGRKGAADATRVEFSADESRVQLPSVGATTADGGGKQQPIIPPLAAVAASPDSAVRAQPAVTHSSSTDGGGAGRPPGGASQPAVKRMSTAMSAAGDDYADLLGTSPFHLLSQEEYGEHGSSAVTHCKFSKSSHAIVSADTSAVVKVWALNPSPVTVASVVAKSALVSVEWVDPADRLLLIGCAPDVIKLYDVKEKRTVMDKSTSNEMFINKLMAISVDPAGIKFACSSSQTIGSKDSGELMFWDLRTMEREQGLGDNVGITAMTYSCDGRLLVAGCADGSMRVVDISSGSCVRRWNAHNGRVCSLYVSKDCASCYTVGYDSRLYQWSLVGSVSERLAAVSLHESAAGPFSWSSSESVVGRSSHSHLPPVVHHPKDRLFVLNSRETHLLSCGSRGGCMYRVDKEGLLERTMVLGGHRAPVVAVDWSRGVDTETCLTADMAGKIRLSTLLSKDAGGATR